NPAGPDLATTAGWEAMLTAPTRVPLTVDTGTGLLSGVRQVLSPNFDARPAGATPEVLIVHGISLPPGEFGGPCIDRLFTGTLPLLEAYASMSTDRIVGHADVAPDRKSDPWATFDWPRYRALLQVKRDASGVA